MIDSYSESSYLADQVLADLPPLKLLFHRFPLWQLIFHAYSESSYLADQVLADLSPTLNGNFTDSCSDSSYFIPSLRTHIWQTVCWQIYPPSNCYFTDSCSDSLYFMPTLRTHIWQTKCWQIYPPWMAISLVPALTAHISFLLWELIFGRPVVDRSIPPSNGDFTDCCSDTSYFIPSLRAHIWQTRCWQINSLHQIAIIDSYFESSYLADQVLADPPLSSWQFHILLF